MWEDKKHVYRIDLGEIYIECEKRTAYKYRMISPQLDIDEFVISKQERQQIHEFCLVGASDISNRCSYVQNHLQTGIESISYTDEDRVNDPSGRKVEQGEKLYLTQMPEILFDIDAVATDVSRYTVVQQLIKEALICYILFNWYKVLGYHNESSEEYKGYEKFVSDIRFNSIFNQRSKSVKRKYRSFG